MKEKEVITILRHEGFQKGSQHERSLLRGIKLVELLPTIIENPSQGSPHEQGVSYSSEQTEGQLVTDVIGHLGSALDRLQAVGVNP